MHYRYEISIYVVRARNVRIAVPKDDSCVIDWKLYRQPNLKSMSTFTKTYSKLNWNKQTKYLVIASQHLQLLQPIEKYSDLPTNDRLGEVTAV